MVPPAVDVHDTQGIVLSAWGDLPHAAYALIRLPADLAAAKVWLGDIAGRVTPVHKPSRAADHRLQIALTDHGLKKLSAPDWVIEGLPDELKQGMYNRKRVLGDTGVNDPTDWEFGREEQQYDGLLMVYAAGGPKGPTDPSALHGRLEGLERELERAGGAVLHTECAAPFYGSLRHKEHFGFADGVSQPYVAGAPRPPRPGEDKIPTGEFLLGFENAYGRKPSGLTRGGFGTNGSYLVFRKLEQDVAGFWQYFHAQAVDQVGSGDSAAVDARREWLAARAVGRWRSGVSVVEAPDRDPGVADGATIDNSFRFRDYGDELGGRCPLGSHIRRANPRDSLAGSADESMGVVNRHRILRRGRSYGEEVKIDDALRMQRPVDGEATKRGLLFLSFQTSIARGFEFIQQLWLSNPSFKGLHREVDPLVGGGDERYEHFTIPDGQPGKVRRRLAGLQRYVRVRGGVYLFLPSLSALRTLARPDFA